MSMMQTTTEAERAVNPANRFGVNYAREAEYLGAPAAPIVDVHSHIGGEQASEIFRRACDLYGVEQVYTMTQLDQVDNVRAALGDRVRFIAIPNYAATENRAWHMGRGFLERIPKYHALGSRIVKFWTAPRSVDYAKELGDPDLFRLDADLRVETMKLATDLGMMFMTHIADPDTWFATKYADASVYGTKKDQYLVFERMLDRFTQPWIAAHMGGWPEDLGFLTGLLERHGNLYLDTSATKWQVRELSKHPREDVLGFFQRFNGRILFGSDIVTSDKHLEEATEDNELARKASGPNEAFDLYASRYWALRAMFETDYEGESPIADPDLAMIDPDTHDEMSAPQLSGKSLPHSVLKDLYHDAAKALLDPWHT